MVTVIDGAYDSVKAIVPTGPTPYSLCYDSKNDKVYCADWGGDDVTVIDGAGDSVLKTIGVGGGPYDLVWNPAQNRVYVANSSGSSISVLRGLAGGVQETMNEERGTMKPNPTIIRGVLFLPDVSSRKPHAASLLDISGRKVMDLKPGANDVRALAPGVYFVRAVSRELSAVSCRKVVVTR
jgi:YVTN family beta-propeller protein